MGVAGQGKENKEEKVEEVKKKQYVMTRFEM